MKKTKIIFLLVEIIIIIITTTGCWNYRELDKLGIVTGIAIDKGEKGEYLITFESINLTSEGKNVKATSKPIESKGETIFDAIRNTIKTSGKRLYFSHIKIVIVSEEVAREGLVNIIDFFSRDAESRLTFNILVAKDSKAGEVLSLYSGEASNESFEIEQTLTNQQSLSKAPHVELRHLIDSISDDGISPVLPVVQITNIKGKKTSKVAGTGVFKGDKLVGFLDENQTKDFLFVIDEVKGGIIVVKNLPGAKGENISMEIFKSNTKVKPKYSNGKFSMDIRIKSEISIGELGTSKNYIDEKRMKILKKHVEKTMEKNIKKLIINVQENYNTDVFGFGKVVRQNMPSLWKKVKNEWEDEFRKVEVNIEVNLEIKNSGVAIKPIKVGE